MGKKIVVKNIRVRKPELHIPIAVDYPSMRNQIAEENIWRALEYDMDVVDEVANSNDIRTYYGGTNPLD